MLKKTIPVACLIGVIISAILLFATEFNLEKESMEKKSTDATQFPKVPNPLPNGEPPMITVVFDTCDIDRDGDCDTDDFELFINALGQCEDGDSYNEVADADHDGCVTVSDKDILFPSGPPIE